MKVFTKLLIVGVIGAAFVAFQWSGPTFDPESLKGARVLVTGASTGIGEQMAYHLAGFGAQVVITARREKVLQQVAEKCQVLGAQKALYIAADMANPSEPERVVKFAVDKLGGLDYLVLNHIGPSPFAMWDRDVEHTRWLMQVNFLSYLQMAKTVLPTLEQSQGSIVVVTSLLGKISSPFVAPYTSTKFALNGFFGTLQHELSMQRSNVSITICILGLIDTDSAMEKVRGITNIQAWPASEAALHIITSGATQQTESYYPWFWYYCCLIRDWFPYFRDMSLRNLYKYEPFA
ncbi:hydroxysteroid 11-beta-dehydrogenase 1-like protein isoform X2 [Oncorhynchus nerka]|uniref:hydroxysteroid 11-beta-dehydrogenase 1-like protein isoform X2 n=1 Tax=Oncorhynchus nerka TaxID=8023 RepID=UPI0011318696|nr:hydroxysteroid 11-beta-dehydrogenase 1-like protein [Oncorhynchus nerka]